MTSKCTKDSLLGLRIIIKGGEVGTVCDYLS